jgi:hypothetical protein
MRGMVFQVSGKQMTLNNTKISYEQKTVINRNVSYIPSIFLDKSLTFRIPTLVQAWNGLLYHIMSGR